MSSRAPLVFFDVDSTLVTIEGIDVLGAGNPEIVALTEAAMNGTISLEEVYGRRLKIIRPSREAIRRLGETYVRSMLADAAEVVATLHQRGANVYLITAGIEQAVLPLAAALRIPTRRVRAVRLEFSPEGHYVDFDRRSPLARTGGKELAVRDIRAQAQGRAVLIGDGITDAEARGAVDLFIGFGGVRHRDAVRAVSDVYITEPRLSLVLPHIFTEPDFQGA